jgi:hypothetical protein
MKLHGITLPASLAVSTPTTVPAGALAAVVKLLIVIVMTSPVCNRADTPRLSVSKKTAIGHSGYDFIMFLIANMRDGIKQIIAMSA